jgi:hypothetical protein
MLTLPEGYGVIEAGLFRCHSIEPANAESVRTLKLKVIVSISADRPSKFLRTFAHENGTELIHLALQPWRSSFDWNLLGREMLQDALTYVLDKRNHPLIVVDGTNAFAGVLRKIQHWNYAAIVSEYRAYAGSRTHYMTEIFLEMLDVVVRTHEEAVRRRNSTDNPSGPTVTEKSRRYRTVLHLPPEDVLPDWIKRYQDMWRLDVAALRQQPSMS